LHPHVHGELGLHPHVHGELGLHPHVQGELAFVQGGFLAIFSVESVL
jgi:hypothetical protein